MKILTNCAVSAAVAATTLMMMFPASAQTVLNMSSQLLETMPSAEAERWFAQEIAKRTNDEVKVNIFFGETLARASENLPLLRDGAIDMAMFSASYYASDLPFSSLSNSVPMALNSAEEAKLLMKRLMAEVPEFLEEQERTGIRALFFHNLNPMVLQSRVPVTTLEDMKGKKVRTFGSELPKLVSALGATPITIMLPELYESFSGGTIDVAPFSLDYIQAYRTYEVAPHITDVPLFVGVTGAVWISTGAWNRLTPEQQEVFKQVADEAAEVDYKLVVEAANSSREYLLGKGVTMHEVWEKDKESWLSSLPDFLDEWAGKMETVGKGEAARQTVAIWREVAGGSQ